MTIPSINQNICGQWTEQQVDLYNKLPFYLLAAETKFRAAWTTYKPLLGEVSWKPNSGNTMRRVMNEPTPVLRQEAIPNLLAVDPLTDIINYRERIHDTKLRMQDFVSPQFNYLPEFQDFMKHVDITVENINKQITVFEDQFYRTMLFHWAPYVYVVGVGLVAAPQGDPSVDGSTGKSNAWLSAQFASMTGGQPGNLSFQEIWRAFQSFETEVGATPYEGTGKPGGDSNPLNEKYCLTLGTQEWNQLVDDPWLKENRPLNMNIVTEAFKGDFFGRIRCKLERYPLYYAFADADFIPAQYAPETTELNPDRGDYLRTKPNPPYARPSPSVGAGAFDCSPIGVAFLFGGQAADVVKTGPPPAEFVRDLDQGSAVKMNWNGKTYLTKDFLIPCKTSGGDVVWRMNEFGRYLRAQAELAVGVSLINPQNCMPIIFKRRLGITTIS